MKYNDVPKLVGEFLEFMEVIKNRSANTVKEYHYDLRNTFKYLKCYKQNIDFDLMEETDITDLDLNFFKSVSSKDIYSYLKFLSDGYKIKTRHELKSTSRARKTASIRSFYNYLIKENHLDVNPIIGLESPKLEKRLPKYLTLDESTTLLSSVKFNEQKFGKRDFCILTIFLNCGLRLSELININFKDIKEDRLSIIGKGNKERVVHLNAACLNAINDYIKDRKKDGVIDREALFISERGKRISRRMVEMIVKKYIILAGLDPKKFSPHKLRHTAATLMHKYGNVDIRALQQVLGHESIATTQIYTHVDDEQVKNAIDNNPLNNIKI